MLDFIFIIFLLCCLWILWWNIKSRFLTNNISINKNLYFINFIKHTLFLISSKIYINVQYITLIRASHHASNYIQCPTNITENHILYHLRSALLRLFIFSVASILQASSHLLTGSHWSSSSWFNTWEVNQTSTTTPPPSMLQTRHHLLPLRFTCNFCSKVPQVISPRRGPSASVTTIVMNSQRFLQKISKQKNHN